MKPLQNRNILITRQRDQSEGFGLRLKQAGASPFFLPLIEVRFRTDKADLPATLDWIVITSSNGVRAFFSLYNEINFDNVRFAVVGTKTAQVLQSYGYSPTVVPNVQQANALGEELVKHIHSGSNIFIVKGQLVGNQLALKLRERHAHVQEWVGYDTFMPAGAYEQARRLLDHTFDYVALTSASSAYHFAKVVSDIPLRYHVLACIGPQTAEKAVELGFDSVLTATHFSTEGLIQVMIQKEGK